MAVKSIFEGAQLGDVYELSRDGSRTEVNVTSPFLIKHLREWPMVSLRLVGGTSDTNEEIELKGLLLIKLYLKIAALRFNPTYHLYKNNCQNFVKFLVEAICNTHVSLETIQDALLHRRTFRVHIHRLSRCEHGVNFSQLVQPFSKLRKRLAFTRHPLSWVVQKLTIILTTVVR